MFDSINEKLSDRNFLQSAIDSASKAEARGPYNVTNSPFEKFRIQMEKEQNRTAAGGSSESFSSSSSSSSRSAAAADEEIDAPSHVNPAPSTAPPDLFEDEFEADGNITNADGSVNTTKAAAALHKDGADGSGAKKPHKHGRPKLSGGAGTGQKPSFNFGPPPTPTSPGAPVELPDIMTPKEQMCYSNRYSDLGDQTAIDHYLSVGQEQGRFTKCGKYMTWFAASRYLDRYWEIGDKFGRTGKSSVKLAREHWYTNGSF